MDFELSSLHQGIRDAARQFARQEIAPHAARWDEEERFPKEIVPKLAEMGFLGIRTPEEYGGSGGDMLAYAIVVEEIARADGSLALTVASHNGLGTSHIATFGSKAIRDKYLPLLAHGKMLGAWALTEPGSGSDAAALKTTAVRKGSNWVLNGTKNFITQGSVGGVCVVLALSSPEKKQRGITAFAVEMGTPGFSSSSHIRKLGCRSSDTAELNLVDVEVSDDQRVGEVDHGFSDVKRILDGGRISIGAMALGLGEGALEAAARYAKDRVQFNQPIANFQAIQWMIADSRAELDAARLLIWRACAIAATKGRYTKEASMAKLYASEAAARACNRALQIHGGYGYTREFPVERHLRDAKICEIGEGTSEIQRLVIARKILAV